MMGGLGPQVWDLVQKWTPSEVYDHENKYQTELRDFLDQQLNESNGGGMDGGGGGGFGMGGGSGGYAVSKERGTAYGDVVVNDTVGIELKRNFSNSQKRKLRGQLEDYGDNYEFVIACTCGIEDTDGWREVEQKISGGQRGIMDMTEYRFEIKGRDNFGTGHGSDDGGILGGGGLF